MNGLLDSYTAPFATRMFSRFKVRMPFHPAVWCLGSGSKTSLRSLKLKTSLTMDKNMPLNRFLFTVGMLFSFKHSQKTK